MTMQLSTVYRENKYDFYLDYNLTSFKYAMSHILTCNSRQKFFPAEINMNKSQMIKTNKLIKYEKYKECFVGLKKMQLSSTFHSFFSKLT